MNAHVDKTKGWGSYLAAALFVTGLLYIQGCSKNAPSTTTSVAEVQTMFSSPVEAGQALQKAARAHDEKALAQILGPASKTVLNSGDPAEDQAALDSFVAKYDQMNRWVAMTDGNQVLNIGADNYPYPIPVAMNSSSKWYFNTKAGEDEILARRIGGNELLAIDAISSIANAEEVYFRSAHDGNPAHLYTTMIHSSPGKQDGLHWSVPADQDSSPLGRLSEFAKFVDSPPTSTVPQIFDGYHFRILNAQGDKAKGGAKPYIVNGKMTGGFAVIASPVTYRDSGIMTFILSRDGVVYQRDLGPKTVDLAGSITEYNPTAEWTPVQ
jgi:hypothetical protein